MALKLFELVGTDETRPFSPYCWRTRMALAHKGLGAESIPWRFTEKAAISPHNSEKVPVLLDRDKAVAKSWGVDQLPTTFLLDGTLTPRFVIVGDFDWDRADMDKLIAELSAPQKQNGSRAGG
jgi:Glutathione S-transferase, N-terminal domain